jgi:hypothetical protein
MSKVAIEADGDTWKAAIICKDGSITAESNENGYDNMILLERKLAA